MSGTYLEQKDRMFGCKMVSYRPKQKNKRKSMEISIPGWRDGSAEDQSSDPTSPLLCLSVSEAGVETRGSLELPGF